MTLFLMNEENRTVVDIEINDGKNGMDVSVSTIISTYSKLLIDNIERKDEVIEDFQEIDELRGWFWEVYMETPEPTFNGAVDQIRNHLLHIAEKYKLNYVVD